MTIYRATRRSTPRESPFAGGALRADEDARNPGAGRGDPRPAAPSPTCARPPRRGGRRPARRRCCCPGSSTPTSTTPRCASSAASGMPLLDWLERCALPEEARARRRRTTPARSPREFVSGLVRRGHDERAGLRVALRAAPSTRCSPRPTRVGLRVTTGLVVSDRVLRADLLTTPDRAYDEGRALAERWHGQGRTRYAVTPRFSLSASDAMLESCAVARQGRRGDLVHLARQREPRRGRRGGPAVRGVTGLRRHLRPATAWSGRAACFAHNVHAARPGARRCSPRRRRGWRTARRSNSALGSGLFPLRRHIEAGVRVALGLRRRRGHRASRCSRRGCRPTSCSSCSRRRGWPSPRPTCSTSRRAPARTRSGLDEVGDLSVGRQFDAVWVRPPVGSTLDAGPRARRRAGRRPGQGLRARRRGRHRRGLGRRNAPARLTRADPAAPG